MRFLGLSVPGRARPSRPAIRGWPIALAVLLPTALAAGMSVQAALPRSLGIAQADKPRPPSLVDSIADKVTRLCAGVRRDEVVWIAGYTRDMDLLEALAVSVRKAAGFPVLVLQSERLQKRLATEVDPALDAQVPQHMVGWIEAIGTMIQVGPRLDSEVERLLGPARLSLRTRAHEAVQRAFERKGIRMVALANDLYPDAATAHRAGLAPATLRDLFLAALDAGYAEMHQRGAALARGLLARNLHLTAPNGTDLRFGTTGRQAVVRDGLLGGHSEGSRKYYSEALLPAGDVYIPAVETSASGVLVLDRIHYFGQVVEGLRLVFRDGRLLRMSARSGLDAVKRRYDAATGEKDRLAMIGIGINPRLRPVERWLHPIMAGVVSVAVGGNAWAGGRSWSDFGLAGQLREATLVADGKTLVKRGALVP